MLDAIRCLAVALVVVSACDRDPACEPACRDGFTCVTGACVSACNPPCVERERCIAGGRCAPEAPPRATPKRAEAANDAVSGGPAAAASTDEPTAADSIAGPGATTPPTHCGSPDALADFASLPRWREHRCRDASSSHPGCYPRDAYSDAPGRGCPGHQLCCQPTPECRSTWGCKAFGWCRSGGAQDLCVAGSAADCKASSRCKAIGTCLLSHTYAVEGDRPGWDCCTAAQGGYCVANEVRFEPSTRVRARARSCKGPPPFHGVRRGMESFDVTGEAVASGEERLAGFGDALVSSGGEGGTSAIVLHALDRCGLWLEQGSGDYLELTPIRPRRPTYRVVKPQVDGSFVVSALGARLQVVQWEVGQFRIRLLDSIPAYDGE